MVDEDKALIDFNAEDRCDRCRAQAYTLARHQDFGELMFCLHHRKQHHDTLLDEGWEIVDDYAGIEALASNHPALV